MGLKPISTIKANLGINPGGRVQRFFTDTCAKHMDKYIPKDTGMLRTVIDKTINTITYEMPYAHAQYVGEIKGSPVVNYTTPGTGPYWDERMKSAEMQDVVNEVQEYIRKNGNK